MKSSSIITIFTFLIVLLQQIASANAADQKHVTKLKKTKHCMECDLSSENLNEAQLSGSNLARVNLKSADNPYIKKKNK